MKKLQNLEKLENVDFERVVDQLRNIAIDEELRLEIDGLFYYDRMVFVHAVIIIECVCTEMASEIVNVLIESGHLDTAYSKGDWLVRLK